MTSISKVTKYTFVLALLLGIFFCSHAFAQSDSQTITVSPTLIDMKATPGQTWQSELRVVNVNTYDLMVYPQAVNFAPLDESGRGDLIPIFAEETQGQTLAEWVTITTDPVIIPKQQTVTVPFTITVPENAAPGGHYAAILIGTKPPTDTTGMGQVQTAQFVTSLLFIRVAGDIVEAGGIREFTTTQNLTQQPKIGLSVRFENKGNVHLQPQGDIKIYNMWGSERGIIPINHQTHFGNVLPNSIREFMFTWEGDTSPFDIGRYKAVATLGFGETTKDFSTSTTYFWVIPYTILLSLFAGIVGFVMVVTWLVRRYINHMLALQGIVPGQQPYVPRYKRHSVTDNKTVVLGSYSAVTEPIRTGVETLSDGWSQNLGFRNKVKAITDFVLQYKLFFIGVAFFAATIFTIVLVVGSLRDDDTNYSITIGNPGMAVSLSAEDVAYTTAAKQEPASSTKPTGFVLSIQNASGKNGQAAATRIKLESLGYIVTDMGTDGERVTERTVIVYDPVLQDAALLLSADLGNVLLSASDDLADRGKITVFVGEDLALENAE